MEMGLGTKQYSKVVLEMRNHCKNKRNKQRALSNGGLQLTSVGGNEGGCVVGWGKKVRGVLVSM